jgi:hypothetical protein
MRRSEPESVGDALHRLRKGYLLESTVQRRYAVSPTIGSVRRAFYSGLARAVRRSRHICRFLRATVQARLSDNRARGKQTDQAGSRPRTSGREHSREDPEDPAAFRPSVVGTGDEDVLRRSRKGAPRRSAALPGNRARAKGPQQSRQALTPAPQSARTAA